MSDEVIPIQDPAPLPETIPETPPAPTTEQLEPTILPENSTSNIPPPESQSEPAPEIINTQPEEQTQSLEEKLEPVTEPTQSIHEEVNKIPQESNIVKEEPVDKNGMTSTVRNYLMGLLVKANAAVQTKKQKNLKKLMTLFDTMQKVQNNDVEKFLHLKDAMATRYLNMLLKEGKIRREGTGSATRYYKN